jgi:hypothetical protein
MRKRPRVATIATVVAAAAGMALAGGAQAAATSPTSPVNIATPTDFSAAKATRGATVIAGDARFQILGDGLIRMEYSPSGTFDNPPTVNVLERRFAVPFYRTRRANGWLTISTSEATLRYRLGSGPFRPSNSQPKGGRAGGRPSTPPNSPSRAGATARSRSSCRRRAARSRWSRAARP